MMLYQIVEQSARAALSLQADGRLPAGHNGPYQDLETPVRNTSHWLITFVKAFEITGDQRFAQAAHRAVSYLCSNDARPCGATFWHRKNPEKDSCNGLIGQAWTIEALAAAAKALHCDECQRVAESVFMLHPFDADLGLWRRVSVDGSYLSLDGTLNHQIWFAAAGALLLPSQDPRVGERVDRFVQRLVANLKMYPSGLIRHPLVGARPVQRYVVEIARQVVRLPWGAGREAIGRELYRKAIGYHAFNLYALALLHRSVPDDPFWQSVQMKRALRFVGTEEYAQDLQNNRYGYPYNPPGFEVPFALEVFEYGTCAEQERWASQQILLCYDSASRMMCLNTEDPLTHAARLYEATRLPDLSISAKLRG
ncbi:MAG: agl cluster protein AglQ [Chloroflexi bacterium]|nr:agl cluster protein AglQ [Chloroflexota bacterium]